MTIAIISDIHGNIAALEAVLNDIARRTVDLTVNLGDSLSGPFDAAATAERLMADERVRWFRVHARNLESIHGHDAFAETEWTRPE